MPPSTQASAIRTRPDEDLTDQARSGHGVPSQDPNPAAQFALDPREAEREGHSVLMAGAMVAGMVAGAAIGVSVAGRSGWWSARPWAPSLVHWAALPPAVSGVRSIRKVRQAPAPQVARRPRALCVCTSTTPKAVGARWC